MTFVRDWTMPGTKGREVRSDHGRDKGERGEVPRPPYGGARIDQQYKYVLLILGFSFLVF